MIGAILANAGPVMIPLNKGRYALVDLDDLHLIGEGPWCTAKDSVGTPYAQKFKNGKRLTMHRLIIGTGSVDYDGITDHANGNTLDNRRSNLRPATPSQNNSNMRSTNKFGYRGIRRSRGAITKPYYACVGFEGKVFFTEHFTTIELAARAYDVLAIKHHGEFARLNFPKDKSNV